MSSDRPLAVTSVAWLFIAAGVVAFVAHFPELWRLHYDAFAIELIELLAVLAGVFMLRGEDWARWLALVWMAFHVALTVVPPFHGLAVHILLSAMIARILLRSDAARFFGGEGPRAL